MSSRSAINLASIGLPAGAARALVRPGGSGGPGFVTPAVMTSSERVYISDFIRDAIDIYEPTGGSPIGKITAGLNEPVGLWIDAKGTLYVANLGNGTVTEYAKGTTNPSRTLTGTAQPEAVAVAKTGDVYVSDFQDNVVNVYTKGSTSPSGSASLQSAEGIGIDKSGDVFAAYNESGYNGHVAEYGAGLKAGHDIGISIGMSGDLKIDKSNDLILSDQTNQVIDIYAAGANTPKSTIPIPGQDPFKFCLDRSEKNIYVDETGAGTVLVYSYPAGKPKNVSFGGLTSAFGVAVSPAASY